MIKFNLDQSDKEFIGMHGLTYEELFEMVNYLYICGSLSFDGERVVNLGDKIIDNAVGLCEIVDSPLSDQQKEIFGSAVKDALRLANCSGNDIVKMYKEGELSEGIASFYLGITRLELRQKANDII